MAKNISDINDQYSYSDENPGGKRDSSLVSCAQCGDYNELKYIYDVKLKPLIDQKKITHDAAIKALDEACKEIKNPRKREDFYKLLTEKLGHTIST
ncbi:hypothetical protein [Pseudomonas sp. PA27(2017)]|uniref:hypothetical protein n=1 Tax=Pseudomonas sp. PA27(2017) TaxID=1932112 RepID=UPI000959E5DF|nr:hypothetical protein [Pseudomonas sp. PA27(2017)]OLU26467.1 hypothetical protein BVH06_19200 [Pseudomonas sp. PA27(2017)]